MILYSYFRSGTSHRVRIGLKLKGLAPEQVFVNLATDQQLEPQYAQVNPQRLLPALDVDGEVFIQSPAILEWLDEKYPDPPLLPEDPDARARVRALAAVVGCDIHPINNRRILQYLRQKHAVDEGAIKEWCSRWITDGFTAYETFLTQDRKRGMFSFGNTPTLADVYLVPQIESARRFRVDMSPFPLICNVEQACMELPAFIESAPLAQPDAP